MKRALTQEFALPAEVAAARPCAGGAVIAALVRHYDELVDHVRRYLARWGGDRSQASDVLHDVCVELIETPPDDSIHTPLAFLRHVASCRAIDLQRVEHGRRAWVESVPDLPDAADERAHALDPARIVAGRQRVEALAAAIQALPPRCREVFVMHKIHELPQAEVAVQLDISIKTVEKHLRLGVLACRAALDAVPAAQSVRPPGAGSRP